jgi:hypothetical protein
MGDVYLSLSMSLDGHAAGPNGAMDRVFKHPEPNASVGKVIQTTGLVPERRPIASSECRWLDTGLTARHRRPIAPDRAQAVAEAVELPLSVSKRGALLFARKGS